MKEMCNDFINDTVSVMETTRNCTCHNHATGSMTGSMTGGMTGNITGGMTGSMTGNITGIIGEQKNCNDWLIDRIGLAQAYIAPQPNANTMSQEQSLICGTAFGDLVQPYIQGSNLVKFL